MNSTSEKTKKRPRISLRLKAILFVAALQIILFMFLTYVLIDNFHMLTEKMFQEHFVKMAEVLGTGNEEAIRTKNIAHLQYEIDQLSRQEEILYVMLYDSAGTVVVQHLESRVTDWNLEQDKALALGAGKPMVRSVGPSPGGFFHEAGHNLEINVPIWSAKRRVGTIRMGVTTLQHNRDLAFFSKRVMMLLLSSFFVVGVLLFLVDRRVRHTVHRLMHTAGSMAKGDLSQRVKINTGDELEKLGQTFNTMADALEERDRAIQHHQEELEIRVQERTRELEEERNKLRAIIDNVPSAFLLVDKNRIIQAASQNLRTMGGFEKFNFVGRHCDPVLWKQSFCSQCLVEKAFESGKVVKKENQHLKADGSFGWIEQIAVPVTGVSGVEAAIEILTDITERKNLESKLIRSEKLATTGEMAAVIAHELRNSLTSLKMILQVLQESRRLNEEDLESLAVSLDSVGCMEQVVNDLLQFARPRPMNRTPSNLNDVVRASIDMARHELERKGIEINLKLDEDLPSLIIDPKFLEEALLNLILNSIQAINEKGKIHIQTSVFQLPQTLTDTFIENRWNVRGTHEWDEAELAASHFKTRKADYRISMNSNENSSSEMPEQRTIRLVLTGGTTVVRIVVKDNGAGIPVSEQARIFDPFYTTKLNGTGLGLSLVKRIVNQHRGIIDFFSQPGEGTTFTMMIPLDDDHAQTLPE